MTFELTEQQVKDLTVFLSRIQLQGFEAENFVGIVNALKTSYDVKGTNEGTDTN